MRYGNLGEFQIRRNRLKIDPVPAHEFAKIRTVNNTEGVQPVDIGHNAFGFNAKKAAEGNGELLICVFQGYFGTSRFYVTKRQSQGLTKRAHLLAWGCQ